MPESITTKDAKEAKEWLASKIKHMKEMHISLKAYHQAAPEKGKFPTFKAYLYALSEMYRQLTDIYEVLDWIVGSLNVLTKEADRRSTKINKELRKLRGKFGEHEPTLKKLKEAFEMTERVLREGR